MGPEYRAGRFQPLHSPLAPIAPLAPSTALATALAVANKDDMLYRNSGKYLDDRLPVVGWAKALYVSAKTGLRTKDVFDACRAAAAEHRRRVSTAVMNEVLEDGVRWQRPPSTSTGRQGAIYYCAQVSVMPPTIAIFCNDPALFSDTYRRYLERHFRKSLGFNGTPIRLLFRGRSRRDAT